MITAIGMTEPNCGSDLKASTTAEEGDHYVVNGQKTFITNGHMCDMAIVAVKQIIIHKEGVPCLLLAAMEGFNKGLFNKLGMKLRILPSYFR
jgi:acyl-CoA dehydrogenase